MEWGIFLALTAVTGTSALAVIIHRNPIYSAVALVVTLLGLGGFYILLQAQLVAMVHIIVYAGAIVVLFLFVIMLLDVRREEGSPLRVGRVQLLLGTAAGAALLLLLAATMAAAPAGEGGPPPPLPRGNTQAVGQLLFTRYLLPFELTSLILLVAMVGALMLAKRKVE
ncbi:MAG TPA: NADH-quinone oxidoreductase subunit J [Candidatus Methylomirabilis sp.]|nr:NADH-quinone oxidoreductase subunit J [Candidatus Methylomirabilis sp.]